MKDCVVLTGDVGDANQAGKWAASCARKARMTAEEGKALAARVRDLYVKACQALFGGAGAGRMVVLSAEFGNGAPQFQICADGALTCDALGPKCNEGVCDGLTCFRLPA